MRTLTVVAACGALLLIDCMAAVGESRPGKFPGCNVEFVFCDTAQDASVDAGGAGGRDDDYDEGFDPGLDRKKDAGEPLEAIKRGERGDGRVPNEYNPAEAEDRKDPVLDRDERDDRGRGSDVRGKAGFGGGSADESDERENTGGGTDEDDGALLPVPKRFEEGRKSPEDLDLR